jgi:hypothetical protein
MDSGGSRLERRFFESARSWTIVQRTSFISIAWNSMARLPGFCQASTGVMDF